jgi:hypothetical protein
MAKAEVINRQVSPNGAKNAIRKAFKKQRPLFLWGPPGIGKSDVIHQLGGEMDAHVIDIRLSLWEPTDIKGIPYFDSNSGTMVWGSPSELPTKEFASKFPHVILFLDEMNSAAPSVQAAAYQLILNRRVGQYRLPDNVLIVAAGNREADKGVTYRMPAPLANRFVHLEMRPDHAAWENWAVNNKIHNEVVGYVGFAKQDLYDFDPRSSSRSFATPRSWSFVSQLLQDEHISDSEMTDLVAGAVGEGVAIKFMAHRKVAGQLPKPSDILAGKITELKVKEISAMYSLTIAMCYELQDASKKDNGKPTAEWHSMADYFFKFMMDNFSTELTVMGARVALTTYNLPFVPGKLKNFDEFHKRFGKYIVAASQK